MVEANILECCQDADSGRIVLKIQFKVDGVEVSSQYPLLNGKHYHPTRYSESHFEGLDKQGIIDWLGKDVERQCGNYIKKTFSEKVNTEIIKDIETSLVGLNIKKSEVEIERDTKIYIVKTDGTKELKAT